MRLTKRRIMNMKLRNIPFSPPDMTEAEAKEVREAILSGWNGCIGDGAASAGYSAG